MAYQLYRNTTLGNSLQESLDELIQVRAPGSRRLPGAARQIQPDIAMLRAASLLSERLPIEIKSDLRCVGAFR